MSLVKKFAALSILQLLCLTGCGGTEAQPVNDEMGTSGQMVCDPSLGPGYFAGCGSNIWVKVNNCPKDPATIWVCQRTDGHCELYTNRCEFASYDGNCDAYFAAYCS